MNKPKINWQEEHQKLLDILYIAQEQINNFGLPDNEVDDFFEDKEDRETHREELETIFEYRTPTD